MIEAEFPSEVWERNWYLKLNSCEKWGNVTSNWSRIPVRRGETELGIEAESPSEGEACKTITRPTLSLKWKRSEGANWNESKENVQIFPSACVIRFMFHRKKYFFSCSRIWASQGSTILVHSLPMKDRKWLGACGVFHTFPHSLRVST